LFYVIVLEIQAVQRCQVRHEGWSVPGSHVNAGRSDS